MNNRQDYTVDTYSCGIEDSAGYNSLTLGADMHKSADGNKSVQPFVRLENYSDKVVEISNLDKSDWLASELLYMGGVCKWVSQRDSTTDATVEGEELATAFGGVEISVAGTRFFVSSFVSKKRGVTKVIDAFCPVQVSLYSHWHLVFTKDDFSRFADELLAIGEKVEYLWSSWWDETGQGG